MEMGQPFSYLGSEFLAKEAASTRIPRSFDAGDRLLCWLIVFIAEAIISCFSFLVNLDIICYFLSGGDDHKYGQSRLSYSKIVQDNIERRQSASNIRNYSGYQSVAGTSKAYRTCVYSKNVESRFATPHDGGS